MKSVLLLLVLLCLSPLVAISQVNLLLKRELDSMYVLDQRYRAYMGQVGKNQLLADSLMTAFQIKDNLSGTLWTYQNRVDSLNLTRLEQIVKIYGYPGSSLVGKPTNEAAWYILQHSPKIGLYFPLVKQAGQANELPFSLVAMMEDRLLTEQLKPQTYGTQIACYPLRANSTKQECFVWPILDPNQVNQRRTKAGLAKTVEENAKRFDIEYKILTMEAAKKRYVLGSL
ncbi:DUF6624 domain-containing protein [Spirosoma arcticum]